MRIDYAEPRTRVNERTHNWQHLYSIFVKHGTGQIEDDEDDGELDQGETKLRILRCANCGQVWRHP